MEAKKEFKQITLFGVEEREYEPCFPSTKSGRRPSAKMRAFARNFLETHKLGESAIRAGYSAKNAHIIANRLIKNSLITELIKAEEEAALKRAGIGRTRALMELAKLAYFDLRQLYREDGSLKDPGEWDDATAAAVASVEVFEEFAGKGKDRKQIGHTKRVKIWDKNRALEMLLKHLGLLKENVVFPDKDGNPMSPGVQIQNRIEVVFVNAPGPGGNALNSGNGEEGGD